MARFTKVWLIAALAAVGACNKDGGGAAGAGGAAGGAVAILPGDSQYVIGVNVAAIRQSALWKQYGSELTSKLSTEEQYTKVVSDCGFDPIQTINSLTIGLKSMTEEQDAVMVIDGLDKAKLLACADKEKDLVAKNGGEISHDADTITVKNHGEMTVIGFSGNTVVIDSGKTATKEALAAILKGDHSLAKSTAFTGLLGKVHTSDALWAVINGDVPLLAGTPLGKPQAIYGSVQVTDGISMDGHIKAGTADAAKAFVDMATKESAKAKMFVDKLDITNAAEDVSVAVVIGSEKLKTLKQMAGAFIPGM